MSISPEQSPEQKKPAANPDPVNFASESGNAKKLRPLSPHMQAYNMFAITSLTSILHRITGAALTFGSLLVVAWVLAIAHGESTYNNFIAYFHNSFVQIILFGFTWAFWYHFINGCRHLTWDTGASLGRETARLSGKIIIVASIVVALATWGWIYYAQ